MKLSRPGKIEDYVLLRDRDSESPTTFIYRSLTWEEMAQVNQQSPMSIDKALQISEITNAALDEGRDLTDEEATRVNELQTIDMEFLNALNKQSAFICKLGLTEIKNLLDENGNPYEITPEEFVRYADPGVLRELSTQIIQKSRIKQAHTQEDAEKN